MCFAFIDLDNASPKEIYPLLSIDQLVDATAEYDVISFFDAYLGYNQIHMSLEDKEKKISW